jgi:UDP-N-acetyl-D-glucosamine dehydrogenase
LSQTIAIIGAGYVGVPLAHVFAEAGQTVVLVDVEAERVAQLNRGESYIEDVPSEALERHIADGRLTATTDYDELRGADAILIALPTPLSAQREPDLDILLGAVVQIAPRLRKAQLVVLESTTYPGTTREEVAPILERSGLKAGEDFHLAFSPERVDPGREDWTTKTTPKVVGGLTDACGDRAEALYRNICDEVVRVSTPEVAELSKLLENIFRSVNIALVNELAVLADRMGIDVWEVIDAAATKPYGFMRFDPGPGMGGHCLPVDPFYLSWRAREYDFVPEFVELAGKMNQAMPYVCVERIVRALNDAGKAVRGSRIVLLGVAYKPGVGDTRESPALKILELLREHGGDVVYHDPHVHDLPQFDLSSTDLDAALDGADLAVIVTAHPDLDLERVVRESPLVMDLRGVTRGIEAPGLVRL